MSNKDSEQLQHTIKAFIRKGREYYVAQCFEIAVVTQGKSLDETVANLGKPYCCTWRVRTCLNWV